MKREFIAFVILLIMPALTVFGQNKNCRMVYKGHGVTQMDCANKGRINTVAIAGLDPEMGDTHVFIEKSIDQAKDISKRFHSPNHPKCFDYFRTTGSPVGDALSRPLDENRLPWYFLKAIAGLNHR